MTINFPLKIDLARSLVSYEKAIDQCDFVLLDTNIISVPFFLRGDHNNQHLRLCKLVKNIDSNPNLFPLKLFLEYNLSFFIQLMKSFKTYRNKIYVTNKVLAEVDEGIKFFKDVKKRARSRKIWDNNFGINQESVVRFYNDLAEIIYDNVNQFRIPHVVNSDNINTDRGIVSAAYYQLRRKKKGVILSSDLGVCRDLDFAKAIKQFRKRREIYVIGYNIIKGLDKTKLSVLWSYDKSRKIQSIDEVFG